MDVEGPESPILHGTYILNGPYDFDLENRLDFHSYI